MEDGAIHKKWAYPVHQEQGNWKNGTHTRAMEDGAI